MADDAPGRVTELLRAWSAGDAPALHDLTPLVDGELRRLARGYMSRERPGHTLQVTALVNEAFLRLVAARQLDWQDRGHFLGVSARLMRRVLVDYARSRNSTGAGRVAAGVALAALVAAALAWGWVRSGSDPPAVIRASLMPPEGVNPGLGTAISNDGRRLAFAGIDASGNTRLWVRSLEAGDGHPLDGTEGAMFPFWSPDDRRIGFFAGGKLKTVGLSGGAPLVVCDAPIGRGGTWAGDTIVFAPFTQSAGLQRVAASGGAPAAATVLDPSADEGSHRFPSFLPDGRHFLYEATGPTGDQRGTIYVGSIDEPGRRTMVFDTTASVAFAPPDQLLFVRGGTLWAQTFDPAALALRGEPVALAADVQVARIYGYQNFSVSRTGVLQYQPRHTAAAELVWRDAAGTVLGVAGPAADYLEVALSPDGRAAAAAIRDPKTGMKTLHQLDLTSGVLASAGHPDADSGAPVWAPDGRRLAFSSNRASRADIYVAPVDHRREPELVMRLGLPDSGPANWSRDRRWLAVLKNEPALAATLWLLPLQPPGDAFPVVRGGNVYDAQFSPDGRSIAYSAEDANRREVFIQRLPLPGPRLRVSAAGGGRPRWSGDGATIYFVAADRRLMAAVVGSRRGAVEPARALFDTYPPDAGGSPLLYEVAADGRFLMVRPRPAARVAQSTIVAGWPGLLPR